ncbi:MAG: glycine cleavage system protein GcvH [Ignavibacteriales bacterium]|nr:glycine cleavage system protein GcvH [Ignavibacteriales bacterium]
MNFPEHLKYTNEHEWIHIEGNVGVVGITEYAQGELGDVVFVELPAVGKQFKQGDTFGTVEAVKAVSDLFAPISGEVLEVNAQLEKTPELVNKEPYGGGWMVKFSIGNNGELSSLLTAQQYREQIGK